MVHRIDQHTPTRHTQSHTRTTTRQVLSLLNPIEIACLARVSRHYRFLHISCVCLALHVVSSGKWQGGRGRHLYCIHTLTYRNEVWFPWVLPIQEGSLLARVRECKILEHRPGTTLMHVRGCAGLDWVIWL